MQLVEVTCWEDSVPQHSTQTSQGIWSVAGTYLGKLRGGLRTPTQRRELPSLCLLYAPSFASDWRSDATEYPERYRQGLSEVQPAQPAQPLEPPSLLIVKVITRFEKHERALVALSLVGSRSWLAVSCRGHRRGGAQQ
jgi:hypothetical protein